MSSLDPLLDRSSNSKKKSMNYDILTHNWRTCEPEPPKHSIYDSVIQSLNIYKKTHEPEPESPKHDWYKSTLESLKKLNEKRTDYSLVTLNKPEPEPPKYSYHNPALEQVEEIAKRLNSFNRTYEPEPPRRSVYDSNTQSLNIYKKTYEPEPEPPKHSFYNPMANLYKPKYESSSFEPPNYTSSKAISRYEPQLVEVETPKPDIFTYYKPKKLEFPKCESSVSEISKSFHAPTIDDKINNAWTSKLLEEAGEVIFSTTTHMVQRKLSAFASGATQCLITAGGLLKHVVTDFVIGLPSRMLDHAMPRRYRNTGRADVSKGIVTGLVTFAVTLNPIAALIPVAIGFFRSLFRKRW